MYDNVKPKRKRVFFSEFEKFMLSSFIFSFNLPYFSLIKALLMSTSIVALKFVFSKKATKIDKIFIVDLTVCSKCQTDGEDLVIFCGLPRKHEL